MHILIVDDEPHIRQTLRVALEAMGHTAAEASDSASALLKLQQAPCDALLVDLMLGTESGIELMEQVLRGRPDLPVVIITAHGSIDRAVEAMRRGAFDFLPKPFTPAQVRAVLERVVRIRSLHQRVADLEEQVRREVPEAVLESPDPHACNDSRAGPPRCRQRRGCLDQGRERDRQGSAGQADSRLEPQVQRSVRHGELSQPEQRAAGKRDVRARPGAFTGAVRDTSGKVAAATGGTLFLDEIADLPLALQPKLLRFLQDRQYERVGETRTKTADVRLIAATNRDLEAEAAAGRFRDDLLYRLNVVEFTLPPLRLRSDRVDLANHLLAFFSRQTGRKLDGFSAAARAAISSYTWPGNLRELRNAIERAVLFATKREIEPGDLPGRISTDLTATQEKPTSTMRPGGPITLEQLEAEHIRLVLEDTETREEAARILGIDPSTLYRKRKHLGL